jgi:hypothetical protein
MIGHCFAFQFHELRSDRRSMPFSLRQQGALILMCTIFRAERGKSYTKEEKYRSAEGEKTPTA